jgi:hypothetical protein
MVSSTFLFDALICTNAFLRTLKLCSWNENSLREKLAIGQKEARIQVTNTTSPFINTIKKMRKSPVIGRNIYQHRTG